MKTVAYLRVSGQGQTDGDGFPRQCEIVERFAATRGLTIVNVFFEDFSGAKDERPAFEAMLAWCRDNSVSIILVENMERLARKFSVGELLVSICQERKLTVFECTSGEELTDDDPNPDVWLRGAFKMMMAEYDRRKIVHRTRVARTRIRNSGSKCEGAKGYHDDPNFPLGPTIVARAQQLRDLGHTYRDIAATLANEGFPTMNGGQWRGTTVHKMLKRAA